MGLIEDFDDRGMRMLVLGYPMYGATFLVILHCAAMAACALLTGFGHGDALGYFMLTHRDLMAGHVWQLITYAFVAMPSLSFAVDMLMLSWFGMGLETSLGRPRFFTFYALLLLVQSLFHVLVYGALIRAAFEPPLAGLGPAVLGIFIAYATIYPDVEIFFGITAKLIAYILLGIYVLNDLAYHNWSGLMSLSVIAGLSYCAMRVMGFQGGFDWWDSFDFSWGGRRSDPPEPAMDDGRQDPINLILDKIASRGINSLTEAERRALERAGSSLRRKHGGESS
ncbi:MAG: rhomboid family intramembrane serine protease [Elusimicrobia bacterium]|nr:rhomboid family intramembrane serine protease [Elusimicrobiota bacterium]